VIKLENVTFGFDGAPLFADVSLHLAAGSFQFLTGASGAGKTTLMRLCYADLRAAKGLATLFDRDATALTREEVAIARRRIGVVHQDCAFIDHLSVAENIALPLTVSGRQDETAQNLPELLAWVGLTAQAQQKPAALSGGERQRAALARAVIMSPDVILADEPTGNVDPEMSQRLMTLLVELNRMGKAVLIATHDLSMIRNMKAEVNARVLRLKAGQLTHAGADL